MIFGVCYSVSDSEDEDTTEVASESTSEVDGCGDLCGGEVVSIGAFLAFKFIFTPPEYIQNIPPLSSYIINICLVLFK